MRDESASLESLLSQSGWLAGLARALVQDAAKRDDLVQEVWLAALKNPPQVGRERSWLRSVFKRRLADHGRARQTDLEIETVAVPSSESDPFEAASTLESHARLGSALRDLPEPYRGLIVARYFRGEEPVEMARRAGCPAATLRSQLSRGLVLLRERLEKAEEGGHRNAWVLALIPMAARAPDLGAVTTTTFSTLFLAKIVGVVMTQKIVISLGAVAVGICLFVLVSSMNEPMDDLENSQREVDSSRTESTPRRAHVETAARDESQSREKASSTAGVALDDLRVLLEGSDSRAISNASVVLHRREEILEVGRTDEKGRFEAKGRHGNGTCSILAPDRSVISREIALAGEVKIATTADGVLAGRVRVAGGLPYRPLELRVRQSLDDLESIPASVRALLWPNRSHQGSILTRVNPDGTFRMEGLVADQGGSIRVSQGFGFATERRYFRQSQSFDRPRQDLVLDLVALPRMVGRLIEAETGKPIPRQTAKASFGISASGRATVASISDEEGRFVIGLSVLDFQDVEIHVPWGGGVVTRSFAGRFRDTLEVGDISLEKLQSWRYEVVDRGGRPVPKALAAISGGVMSTKTDEEGLGMIPDLKAEFLEAWVGAQGFRSRKVTIVRGERPQRIELGRANELVVRVAELPEGLSPGSVSISGPPSLLPESFHFDLASDTVNRSSFGLSRGSDRVEIEFARDHEGRFWIQDLEPDVPFDIRLSDPQGQLIAEERGVLLALDEKRILDMRLDPGRVRLLGLRFFDQLGNPVKEVSILDVGDETGDSELYVGDSGEFLLLRDRSAPEPGIRIEREGFAPKIIPAADLRDGLSRVVLDPLKH